MQSFGALVGQMVTPCGYDYTVVGGTGAALLFAGVVGAAVVAPILARYRNYCTMQKVVTVLACSAAVWVLGTGVPGAQGHLIASWLVYGALVAPLIPITLEHAAEVTYPTPPDVSAALLFFSINALCFALTLGLGDMLARYDVSLTCASVVTPFSGLVFFLVLLGALLILPLKSRYLRTEANEAAAAAAAKAAAATPDEAGSSGAGAADSAAEEDPRPTAGAASR